MSFSLVNDDPWKPCDLRGTYPDAVNPELFWRIGGAAGTMLWHGARVMVMGDFRLSTPPLKQALIDGLIGAGIEVIDGGQGPTPVAYHALFQVAADAVFIVTASHNPPEYNGLKLMMRNTPANPEMISILRHLVASGEFRERAGSYMSYESADLYMAEAKTYWQMLCPERFPRVILDAGNGAWSELAPRLFRELGFDIECLACEIDGNFPSRPADCSVASNLIALQNVVRKNPGSIGIAWDGDGDRVSFVDEEGRFVTADQLAQLLVIDVLDGESGDSTQKRFVVDLKCSDMVRRTIEENGGIALLERTGHAFMRTRMVKEGAVLGLDACGHYFFGELRGGDDGLYASLRILHIIQKSACTLREVLSRLPSLHGTPEIRISTSRLSYEQAAGALRKQFPQARQMTIDGLRLVLEDGIVMVRESGTEPVISMRLEGSDASSYERILSQCLSAMPEEVESIIRMHVASQ